MVKAIELNKLTKTYGSTRGLIELSLTVERGEVFGYLGPNGAGKSTTIRLLLDSIRPTSGTTRVLGMNPRADAVALHTRIGYLADDFVAPGRQRVGAALRFLAALRDGAGAERIDELCERLELDQSKQISTLSKRNRQKVGLVQAFMHEPDLLTYIAGNLAGAIGADWLKYLSPFHYYIGGEPLRNGMRWADLAILLAVTAVLATTGFLRFARRDLRS